MADEWIAPGSKVEDITYSVIRYSTGEWAIIEKISKPIAWFPDRGRAVNVCKMLLPCNAKREF